MASSSRSTKKNKLPLNNGLKRKSWFCPETDEEWLLFGKTRADFPITEMEEAEWESSWFDYVKRYDGDLDVPPMYDDTNRISMLAHDPPASQVMPNKLREEIKKANEDIDEHGELWKKMWKIQLEKEEEIDDTKEALKRNMKDLKVLEDELKQVNETEDNLQRQLNEHYDFISKCKDVYPH